MLDIRWRNAKSSFERVKNSRPRRGKDGPKGATKRSECRGFEAPVIVLVTQSFNLVMSREESHESERERVY